MIGKAGIEMMAYAGQPLMHDAKGMSKRKSSAA